MITTTDGTTNIWPLRHADKVAVTTGPAGLDLGDLDRYLSGTETDQLRLHWELSPLQALRLAQQLTDAVTVGLSADEIEELQTQALKAGAIEPPTEGTTVSDKSSPDPGHDAMAAALTAQSLIETDDRAKLAHLVPAMSNEASAVLGSAVWSARFLAQHLAAATGSTYDTVIAALRDEIEERFTNTQESDDD